MATITPKRSLGQNFLKDQNIARKIVASLGAARNDLIIEIGPGTGNLTRHLLELGIPVIAIEIDQRAVSILKDELSTENLTIIHSDILDFDLAQFARQNNGRIKIVGNLPYYISSQILFYVFKNVEYIDKALFMFQKEVAKRLIAKPRTKDYGILTLATELSGSAKILFDVSPKCFFPEPKVWSSIVEINFNEPIVSRQEYQKIMEIVRIGFNQRRKTLKNSLKNYVENKTKLTINQYIEGLDDETAEMFSKRAEELSSADFILLCELLNKDR
jgi:16S rRNA (adenine1518-N6/adenine1519-N6)-dimethyltransferase